MEKELAKTVSIIILVVILIGAFTIPGIISKHDKSVEDDFVIKTINNGIIYLGYSKCEDINETLLIENNQTEYLNQIKNACEGEKILVNLIDRETYSREIINSFISENINELRGEICR